MARRKINIQIDADITDAQAIACVQKVIEQGRISKGPRGEQYCWASRLGVGALPKETIVYAYRTRIGSDSFIVHREPSKSILNVNAAQSQSAADPQTAAPYHLSRERTR